MNKLASALVLFLPLSAMSADHYLYGKKIKSSSDDIDPPSDVIYTDEAIQEDLEKILPGLKPVQIQCIRGDANACRRYETMLTTLKQLNHSRKKDRDAGVIAIDALLHATTRVLREEQKRKSKED